MEFTKVNFSTKKKNSVVKKKKIWSTLHTISSLRSLYFNISKVLRSLILRNVFQHYLTQYLQKLPGHGTLSF